ncbi:PIN domain-containing protein [Dethiobacter alkaliphilus]|uniref:PIN domain-containing protein n=1 Tax=Dethiobacter alkaliphilus AHT 1 TaxID=555088 RepID=C0GD70_DETAL|nr:PIN domain-containing protein [Dethiobacter alkaliphilus]EEG78591.1 conserved hypothetical protein [Dethiobacter alkaliphilus AHT 1]MCW3491636.1 PIN domain-containing protein [Dethiobacter alkaliphilus]
MNIVDANIILRYLLSDNDELTQKAALLIENEDIFVPNEVIAEIVYVLQKVYKISNKEICRALRELFDYDNIQVYDKQVIFEALQTYSTIKIDFVDSLLLAYKNVRNHEVYSFDKQLIQLLTR